MIDKKFNNEQEYELKNGYPYRYLRVVSQDPVTIYGKYYKKGIWKSIYHDQEGNHINPAYSIIYKDTEELTLYSFQGVFKLSACMGKQGVYLLRQENNTEFKIKDLGDSAVSLFSKINAIKLTFKVAEIYIYFCFDAEIVIFKTRNGIVFCSLEDD